MTVFTNYALYYDLLYRDKDYVKEGQFIHQVIKNHAPNATSILELGCGTGIHACLLAEQGYQIHGVDQSPQMLVQANSRSLHFSNQLKFSAGDIRQIRLGTQFDVVISLFHVISYQTTNADLEATFTTVKEHLKVGGVFIFDVWYGPTVLSDRPTVRVKRLEDKAIKVTRIAEPIMYPNENLVDVNYDIFITDKVTGTIEELQESHTMRYLFQPELESFFSKFQLKIIEAKEWVTQKEPSFETWGVYFVVKN